MKNILRSVSYVPKRLMLAAAAVVVAFSTVAAPIANVAAVDANVRIEGTVKVAIATRGAADTSYKDSVNAKVDDLVKVEVYYHNKENFDSGKIAQNLRVGLDVPTAMGKKQTINGTIKADNSNAVTDSADVNLSLDNARLEYVAGSAKWKHNKGATDGRAECQTGAQAVPAGDPKKCYVTEGVSDNIAKGGTGVVLENLKPCFAYEATVTILMRVKADAVKVNKYVSLHDGDNNVENNDWKTKNTAKPGDKLDYMIRFENKSNTRLEDVAVGDNLPDYLTYVPGSSRIYTTLHPNGIAGTTDNIHKGGINVGSFEPGSTGYVVFTVKISENNVFAKCGMYTLKNVGIVRPKGMIEFYNTAWTDINIECAPGEEPQPPVVITPETPVNPEQPATPGQPGTPGELPSTGPASVMAGLFGSSALGYGIHMWILSRRRIAAALNQ